MSCIDVRLYTCILDTIRMVPLVGLRATDARLYPSYHTYLYPGYHTYSNTGLRGTRYNTSISGTDVGQEMYEGVAGESADRQREEEVVGLVVVATVAQRRQHHSARQTDAAYQYHGQHAAQPTSCTHKH